MASSRHTDYRDFSVETRVIERGRAFVAAFTFYSMTASIADRTTRVVDGEFKTEDEAHAVASRTAQKLINLLLDDALGNR